MIKIEIEEVMNGFKVVIADTASKGEYVYPYNTFFTMMKDIGKRIYGRKIKVEEE